MLEAVAEREPPKTVDGQQPAVWRAQLPGEIEVLEVIRADPAVAVVPDQQMVAEAAETGRRDGHAPRSVQLAVRGDTLDQEAVGIENVDEAESFTGDLVIAIVFAHRIGDVEIALEVHDVEGLEAGRHLRIREVARHRGRRERVVEDVDLAVVEVRRVQAKVRAVAGDRDALVDGAVLRGERDECARAAFPRGDPAILGGPQEDRGRPVDQEVGLRGIGRDAGRRAPPGA